MRLHLDTTCCQGHGRCHALAPELIGVDECGHAVLRRATSLDRHWHAQARLVVANCPEGALRVVDDGD